MSETIERLALRVQLPAFPGTSLTPQVVDLLGEGLGGICLFGSNTVGGQNAVRDLTAAIHTVAPHALVAVDEEGGDVTRMHASSGSPVLGPAALGAVDDLALTRATGRAVGTELAAVGVDLNFGPVADVNSNPENPVIGTRSFGADADRVAEHVAAWVSGLQEAGVAACAKHFPGHGDTARDSHLELPRVDVDRSTLERRELAPFGAAIRADAAAVMTSHLLVPALDPQLPATLSATVLTLLREGLGFQGAIVSDALDMAGASRGRGIAETAVLALDAGVDILCLGADKDVALVREVQDAIVAAVTSGRLPVERLLDAGERAAHVRRAAALAMPVDASAQLEGARQALAVEGTLPQLRGAIVVTIATAANIAVGDVPWGLAADHVLDPETSPAPELGRGPLIVQVRDAHRHPAVGSLLAQISRGGRPMVVVEWGWPDAYGGGPRICTRGYSQPGVVALTELLRRAGWDR